MDFGELNIMTKNATFFKEVTSPNCDLSNVVTKVSVVQNNINLLHVLPTFLLRILGAISPEHVRKHYIGYRTRDRIHIYARRKFGFVLPLLGTITTNYKNDITSKSVLRIQGKTSLIGKSIQFISLAATVVILIGMLFFQTGRIWNAIWLSTLCIFIILTRYSKRLIKSEFDSFVNEIQKVIESENAV